MSSVEKEGLEPEALFLVGGFAKRGFSKHDIDILIIPSKETMKRTVFEFENKNVFLQDVDCPEDPEYEDELPKDPKTELLKEMPIEIFIKPAYLLKSDKEAKIRL